MDHILFIKKSHEGKIAILITYVDDIILIVDDEEEISQLKSTLVKEFEIQGLGALRYFLDVEVAQSNKGVFITQWKYTLILLKETDMLGCKPLDTHMDPFKKLSEKESSKHIDKARYQRLVGKLIYHHTQDLTLVFLSV